VEKIKPDLVIPDPHFPGVNGFMENGANAFLAKPFALDTLKNRVEKLLKLDRLAGAHE